MVGIGQVLGKHVGHPALGYPVHAEGPDARQRRLARGPAHHALQPQHEG